MRKKVSHAFDKSHTEKRMHKHAFVKNVILKIYSAEIKTFLKVCRF